MNPDSGKKSSTGNEFLRYYTLKYYDTILKKTSLGTSKSMTQEIDLINFDHFSDYKKDKEERQAKYIISANRFGSFVDEYAYQWNKTYIYILSRLLVPKVSSWGQNYFNYKRD